MNRRRNAWFGVALSCVLFLVLLTPAPCDVPVELVGQWGGPARAVAVSENRAYVGVGPRLTVLDVSDPSNPAPLGTSDAMSDDIAGVAVSGSYAYVAAGSAGLEVIDASDPASPVRVGGCDTIGNASDVAVSWPYVYVIGDRNLHVIDARVPSYPLHVGTYRHGNVHAVAASRRYVYLAVGVWDLGGCVQVVDVSRPSAPVGMGWCETSACAYDIAVADGYAYVSCIHYYPTRGGYYFSYTLDVVRVSDPASPASVASIWLGGYEGFDFSSCVAVSGSYAYYANAWGGLAVLDVSDPCSPVRAGSCDDAEGLGFPLDVAVFGTCAYVSGSGGLFVVDVSNPSTPSLAAGFATASTAVAFDGSHVCSGNFRFFQLIDVSDLASPRLTGTCLIPGYGRVYGVGISARRAYVAHGSGGLQVIDISNPGSPTWVGGCETSGYARDVAVAGSYAYVADGDAGLQVIDISNPGSPTWVGGYDTSGYAQGVAVSGSYAYVADGSAGLQVMDISNPSSPTWVGGCETSGYALGVAVSGSYAYVAGAGLQVIDISNPSSPTWVGGCETSGYARDVAVAGGYAYVADGSGGLQVIDISNPATPTWVGGYDTPGYTYDVAVSGSYAYVADDSGGLVILRVATLPAITVTKSADKSTVCPGETITYTVTVEQTEGPDAEQVFITDQISGVLVSYVPGSARLDGQPIVPDPFAGGSVIVGLGTMHAGSSHVLEFQVKVSLIAWPGATIENQASVTYAGCPAPVESNVTHVTVERIPSVFTVTKSADTTTVGRGDIVTYHVVVCQTAGPDAEEVCITDRLDSLTWFVPGSARLDGQPIAPDPVSNGTITVPLGTMVPWMSHVLEFQVGVSIAAPPDAVIENKATVTYSGCPAPTESDSTQVRVVVGEVVTTGFTFGRDNYQFTNEQAHKSASAEMWDDLAVSLCISAAIPTDRISEGYLLMRLAASYLCFYLFENAGYCYGMSASSSIFYADPSLKPLPGTVYSWTVDQALPHLRGYQSGGQCLSLPVRLCALLTRWLEYESDYTPDCNRLFSETAADNPCVIGLYDASIGGHAVVSYKTEDFGSVRRVYVYDPNAPLDQWAWLRFEADALGKWRFAGYGNRNYGVLYVLDLAQIDPREADGIIWRFITGMLSSAYESGASLFTLSCPADALLVDSSGHRIGYSGGQLVNEIPGAEIRASGDLEIYQIPTGQRYDVTITGSESGEADITLAVPVSGTNCTRLIGFAGLPTAADSTATFSFDATGATPATVDIDGDGLPDESLPPSCNALVPNWGVPVTSAIEPEALNRRSEGRWVTCYIEPPPGRAVSEIDINSLVLQGVVEAAPSPTSMGDYDGDGIPDLMVKFERGTLVRALTTGRNLVTLSGRFSDGTPIAGIDSVQVIE